MLPAEVIDQLVSYELGNTNDAYLYLYDKGYAIGFLDDNGITGQQWENSILDMIEKNLIKVLPDTNCQLHENTDQK